MSDATAPSRAISGDDLCKAAFWRSFAPDLHLGALDAATPAQPERSFDRLRRRMLHDGYFSDRDERLEQLSPALGETVKKLVRFGLPPVLLWVYDEPWECFRRLSAVIGHFLGRDYKLLPDFWAWHIDPTKSEAGWRPHRDKDPGALAPDGSPLSLTCWIPLSDANPLNGCMYVVPAFLDANYKRFDGHEALSPHLARALPAKPGDFLIWNQAILHWGSLSSEFADAPRMSMALEFQRGDIAPYRAPLLDHATLPPFSERIRLIAKQILQYMHMYGVPQKHVQLGQFLHTAQLDDD